MAPLRNIQASLVRNSLLSFLILWSCGIQAVPGQGVAIEPMEITVEENKAVHVTVYNDTDSDYIISSRVISETKDKGQETKNSTFFLVNPPLRLLKARTDQQLGVIYLPGKADTVNRDYYLSVSFLPKTSDKNNTIKVPVILVQEIPIRFEKLQHRSSTKSQAY